MTKYYVEIECEAVGYKKAEFSRQVGKIANALFSLEDGAGASFSSSVRRMRITFGVAVVARNRDDASDRGSAIVRTSIHAAGGATPGWEKKFEQIRESVKTEREMVTA